MAENNKELTAEEKLENYFNIWGSSKRSLVSITRQLIFLLGSVTSLLVAAWTILNAFIPYLNNEIFKTITNNLAIVSIVFIAFTLVLNLMYIVTEWIGVGKTQKTVRVSSLIFFMAICVVLTVFLVLTCVEIYGQHKASRDYIYCIYLVICFSCCVYSAVYSFDIIKRNQKYNLTSKLLKSLAFTIGFLGILAIVVFILWIMWYADKSNMQETCFLLARTFITLVGTIIFAVGAQIVLCFAIPNPSKYKIKRVIYLSIIFALLLGLEIWCGSLFLRNGKYLTQTTPCKASMIVLAISTIVISAIDIGLSARFSTHLEKE